MDDPRTRITREALHDPAFAAGAALMVITQMRRYGLTEFTMEPDEADISADASSGARFTKIGKSFTCKLFDNDEGEKLVAEQTGSIQ